MPDQTIARNYVEFIAKGLDELQAKTDAYRKQLEASSKSADGLNKAVTGNAAQAAASLGVANEKLGQMREGMSRIAGPAAAGFAILTGAVMGFVRAGLSGTVEGERLQMRMQMLSREIAGVFLPVISAVTEKISQLVQWFRTLSGEKQNLIMKFILGAAAALAVAMVLPRIVAGVQIVIVAIKALMAVIAAAGTEAGIASGGILPLLGILITGAIALGAFIVATKGGSDSLEKFEAIGRQLITSIMPPLHKLMDALSGVVGKLAEALLPLLIGYFELWARAVIEVADAVMFLITQLEKLPREARLLMGILGALSYFSEDEKKKGADKQHQTPSQSAGGFEDITGTYRRIAQAAANTGASPVEKAADAAAKAADAATDIKGLILDFLIPPLGLLHLLKKIADKFG